MPATPIRDFIRHHYRHFNAAVIVDAAEAYAAHLKRGGRMMVTMGGAMSTAELGVSLAEMIRRDQVHAICCTGANLEEDLFNLVAHDRYVRVPDYRALSAEDEIALRDRGLNRVTDTCIPEQEAIRLIERHVFRHWRQADRKQQRFFPWEYLFQLIRSGVLRKHYQIDPKDSWLVAAARKNIPVLVPGWEDSTLGNMFVVYVMRGELSGYRPVKSGLELMEYLVGWYRKNSRSGGVGFFQIGGGISGDFPICVVPLIIQDLKERCPFWGYFCQISDSTTSYGSYSGAAPNEKITWGKLGADTPSFIIESDATIVAPLVFAHVLGW